MSEEQQRFAKAIRSMQLAGTLFGGKLLLMVSFLYFTFFCHPINSVVCVIHIKPQMEKLLRLVPDTLLKEIQYAY
jgi:hypothetical protein